MAVVGDQVNLEARREVVPERHLGEQPNAAAEPEDHGSRDHAHEPEARHLPVSVRLTVEAVERHVPSSVRVEVLDLMSDLESLGSPSTDQPGDDTSQTPDAHGADDRAAHRAA